VLNDVLEQEFWSFEPNSKIFDVLEHLDLFRLSFPNFLFRYRHWQNFDESMRQE
jgi:hypothetical protein